MRAQTIRRLSLSHEAMAESNSRIVYANLYGFVCRGRYADCPAYDDIIQAASGLADLQSRFSDAYAALAALYTRERTGVGQEIEVPMFETMVSFAMT